MTTKAMKPLKDEMPIQQRRRMPAHVTNGISVLKAPKYLSASRAGMSRPGMPTPFRIIRRSREVDGETWMTSLPKVAVCILVQSRQPGFFHAAAEMTGRKKCLRSSRQSTRPRVSEKYRLRIASKSVPERRSTPLLDLLPWTQVVVEQVQR